MKELSKQMLKYLYAMRSQNPELYKQMIAKIDVPDEMILSKAIDISREESFLYNLKCKGS